MSKRLLVFMYVLAVLIFSGFVASAKTVQETIGVTSVKLDQEKGVLYLTGQFPNPCYTKPTIVIEKTEEEKGQVYLSVVATPTAPICTAVLGPIYKAALNLNELTLSRGKEYSFIVTNYFGTRMRIIFIAHKQPHNYLEEHLFSGILVVDSSKNFAIFKDGDVLPVISPNIELNSLANKEVWLKGFAVPANSQTALLPVSISAIN